MTLSWHFWFQVHLLTGIGRFGEMTYIFDSIKQNDQFELLLKKGVERVCSLGEKLYVDVDLLWVQCLGSRTINDQF